MATMDEDNLASKQLGDLESASMAKEQALVPTLVTLPFDLHFKIFKLLDRVSSTCLGLCVKTLYDVHHGLRGKVPLQAWYSSPPSMTHGLRLSDLLHEWNGPQYVVQWPHLKLRPKGLPWYVGVPTDKKEEAWQINVYNYLRVEHKKMDLRELRCLSGEL